MTIRSPEYTKFWGRSPDRVIPHLSTSVGRISWTYHLLGIGGNGLGVRALCSRLGARTCSQSALAINT